MKTAIFLSVALALTGVVSAASAGETPEKAQQVYTYELVLDGSGAIKTMAPHGFTADATSAALERDIGSWLFRSAGGGEQDGVTRTYLRVVVQPEATGAGYEVVSATTGPAPFRLTQPGYPVSDQLAGREGMVVLKLHIDRDGAVSGADVLATTNEVSRSMADAAAAAARQWQFTPEQVDGQATAATMLWPVCYLGRETSLSECSWNGPDMQRFSSKTVLPLDSAAVLVSQR